MQLSQTFLISQSDSGSVEMPRSPIIVYGLPILLLVVLLVGFGFLMKALADRKDRRELARRAAAEHEAAAEAAAESERAGR